MLKSTHSTIRFYELQAFLTGLISHRQFEGSARDDNSEAIVLAFKHENDIAPGTYFLCDCIGNTVDLCISTRREFKNTAGRLVKCKVFATLIPDARKQLGSPVNGCWVIPDQFYK